MQNASVSGTLTYKELCMATQNEEQNEEQREANMRRRRLYRMADLGDPTDQRKRDGIQKQGPSSGYSKRSQQRYGSQSHQEATKEDTRICYYCGRPGHYACECRAPKSAS